MLLKKPNPPKYIIFEVTGGQWPPIWKMKKTGEANIARELCLNFYQNRKIFRHICPRNTIFITNVSQKIPPFCFGFIQVLDKENYKWNFLIKLIKYKQRYIDPKRCYFHNSYFQQQANIFADFSSVKIGLSQQDNYMILFIMILFLEKKII